MNEPVKKRLVGGLVIAAVGAFALSFVLHDSHPTYTESLRAEKPKSVQTNTHPQTDAHHLASPFSSTQPKKRPVLLDLKESPRKPDLQQGACQYHPAERRASCDSSVKEAKQLPTASKAVAEKSVPAHINSPVSATLAEKPKALIEPGNWLLQVASFRSQGNAQRLRSRLEKQGLPVHLGRFWRSGVAYYRVSVGPGSKTHVEQWKHILIKKEQLRGYIVKK